MASSRGYLEYVMEQLSGLDGISWRAMMGEYVIYYKGRIPGGIYDDRFLVKKTPSALAMMPDAVTEIPYEGGSGMLLVEEIDDRHFLEELFNAMYDELPEPKRRKK